jgi:3-deoxy-manno-octulosonate cytidylyltransferase (CMP-KDO synthetase)
VLLDLGGKPIVQWVYEVAAATSADAVWVAADDERVVKAVESFGGSAVATSPSCPSGTDRVAEALKKIPDGDSFDLVVNLQGDEPFLPSKVVDDLIAMMRGDESIGMGTVAVPAERAEIAEDPSKVKAVLAGGGSIRRALYFTRAAAPFLREGGEDAGMFLHWGIYAYRREVLERLVSLPESPLEKCEKLEQLRALENGISIGALVAEGTSAGIDTPEDLENARRMLKCASR